MKKLIYTLTVFLVLLLGAVNAGTLSLSQTVNNGNTGGGIFQIAIQSIQDLDGSPLALSSPVVSTTFCLEKQEYIGQNIQYSYNLNDRAVTGGINSDVNAIGYDIISVGTASLYERYIKGTLSGNFDVNTTGDGGQLQRAIWALEDEVTYNSAGGLNNPYLNDVSQLFGSFALSKVNYTGNKVKVLNIFDGNNLRQDMLITTFVIPEVSSGLIVACGLCGLVLIRKRY